MKKTYEKPVLKTEQFDVEDIITVSAPEAVGSLGARNANWEISFDPSVIQFN